MNFVSALLNLLTYAFVFAFVAGLLAVVVMYVIDITQTTHAIRRNFPVVGRFRYVFENLGEFFRQYFFAMDREELPFNRAERPWAYWAAKGGVNQLTRALALEWSARGVTVNAVAPTFIYTPGTAERLDDPTYLAGVLAKLPIGKVGTINDVAAAVIYLASPAAAMVTGHVLHVAGGWTAQ